MATALIDLALASGLKEPTTASVLRVTVKLAEAVNKLPGLKGAERLDLVLKTLREVLALPEVAAKLTPEAKAAIYKVVDEIVPETLTLVIDAGRGRFALKKPSVSCVAALAALLCRTVAAAAPAGSQLAAVAAKAETVAETVEAATSQKESAVAAPETPVSAEPAESKPLDTIAEEPKSKEQESTLEVQSEPTQ